MSEVTRILSDIEDGDPQAAEKLLPLVYDELRKLAANKLARESPGQSLQATGLVHEAYLRLVDADEFAKWQTRGHFFAAAAEAMRRILVDRARRRTALKRGGRRVKISFDDFDPAEPDRCEDLIALDDALDALRQQRPDLVQLVTLRFFAGLNMEEAAEALQVSPRTAARNWAYARAWLMECIAEQS